MGKLQLAIEFVVPANVSGVDAIKKDRSLINDRSHCFLHLPHCQFTPRDRDSLFPQLGQICGA